MSTTVLSIYANARSLSLLYFTYLDFFLDDVQSRVVRTRQYGHVSLILISPQIQNVQPDLLPGLVWPRQHEHRCNLWVTCFEKYLREYCLHITYTLPQHAFFLKVIDLNIANIIDVEIFWHDLYLNQDARRKMKNKKREKIKI